jgi:hypothetical protein
MFGAKVSPMKTVHILGILLLLLVVGCSKQQPPPEPVTLSFLDVEWDIPDRLPSLAQDLQDFTRETGIRVKRLPRPEALLDQLLPRGASSSKALLPHLTWSALLCDLVRILNQRLMDLKPYFPAELSHRIPWCSRVTPWVTRW